jgi:hypothetical protein
MDSFIAEFPTGNMMDVQRMRIAFIAIKGHGIICAEATKCSSETRFFVTMIKSAFSL